MERHGIVCHAFTCVNVCKFNWIGVLTNSADWVHTGLGNYSRKVSKLQTFLLSIHNFTLLLLSIIYLLRDETKRRDDIWISPASQSKFSEFILFRYFASLRAVDQKHLESFEMWCWRRMEKISWTDHVRNKDILHRVKEQRNILHEIRKRKANWIGHSMRRNCLLQRVTEGKIQGGIEVTGRLGTRRRKLLDDLQERRGYSHLKEEALDRTMWRARFGRGFGPVVRQNTNWTNDFASITRKCQ